MLFVLCVGGTQAVLCRIAELSGAGGGGADAGASVLEQSLSLLGGTPSAAARGGHAGTRDRSDRPAAAGTGSARVLFSRGVAVVTSPSPSPVGAPREGADFSSVSPVRAPAWTSPRRPRGDASFASPPADVGAYSGGSRALGQELTSPSECGYGDGGDRAAAAAAGAVDGGGLSALAVLSLSAWAEPTPPPPMASVQATAGPATRPPALPLFGARAAPPLPGDAARRGAPAAVAVPSPAVARPGADVPAVSPMDVMDVSPAFRDVSAWVDSVAASPPVHVRGRPGGESSGAPPPPPLGPPLDRRTHAWAAATLMTSVPAAARAGARDAPPSAGGVSADRAGPRGFVPPTPESRDRPRGTPERRAPAAAARASLASPEESRPRAPPRPASPPALRRADAGALRGGSGPGASAGAYAPPAPPPPPPPRAALLEPGFTRRAPPPGAPVLTEFRHVAAPAAHGDGAKASMTGQWAPAAVAAPAGEGVGTAGSGAFRSPAAARGRGDANRGSRCAASEDEDEDRSPPSASSQPGVSGGDRVARTARRRAASAALAMRSAQQQAREAERARTSRAARLRALDVRAARAVERQPPGGKPDGARGGRTRRRSADNCACALAPHTGRPLRLSPPRASGTSWRRRRSCASRRPRVCARCVPHSRSRASVVMVWCARRRWSARGSGCASRPRRRRRRRRARRPRRTTVAPRGSLRGTGASRRSSSVMRPTRGCGGPRSCGDGRRRRPRARSAAAPRTRTQPRRRRAAATRRRLPTPGTGARFPPCRATRSRLRRRASKRRPAPGRRPARGPLPARLL